MHERVHNKVGCNISDGMGLVKGITCWCYTDMIKHWTENVRLIFTNKKTTLKIDILGFKKNEIRQANGKKMSHNEQIPFLENHFHHKSLLGCILKWRIIWYTCLVFENEYNFLKKNPYCCCIYIPQIKLLYWQRLERQAEASVASQRQHVMALSTK